jgi:hypothetical protein
MLRHSNWIFILLAIVVATGCSPAVKRNPVPESLVDIAEVANLEDIRFWADATPEVMKTWLKEDRWDKMGNKSHHYLAISGGGQNGAYGAGFLNGWTASGKRPEFTLVTGISTGALIAPFAFLGPEYDDKIKEFYTEFDSADLIEQRNFTKILSNASVIDNSKLRAKVEQYVTQEMMEKIAVEYKKGRILDIGTTNLDTNRPVVWSIGRIATSGAPNSLELIHDIIVASTSIGGAFPPVIIGVEANGASYDEMHIDGGTAQQVFVYPLGLDFEAVRKRLNMTDDPKIYILRNALLTPKYEAVKYSIFQVLERSFDSLVRNQGIGDIDRIYLESKRDGLDFHLSYIPKSFNEKSDEFFDGDYMNKLYQVGYEIGLKGGEWADAPPGFDVRNTH